MSDKLHIIIADENHSPRSLVFSKKTLKIVSGTVILYVVIASAANIFTADLFHDKRTLKNEVTTLQKKLTETKTTNKQFSDQISQLQYKMKYQLTQFQAEKRNLVNTAVSELKERSQFIEEVMGDIGVKIKKKPLTAIEENSGGPYLTVPKSNRKSLIQQTDDYLKVMSKLPLGRPVAGALTSSFGSRKDPVNKKPGFHSGVDFRGKRGSEVMATADGKVIKAGRNGSYGLYVQIDHGNGYSTAFGHLKKYTVKKGDRISRGQTVGLVGSSGRSTGPHLHYEVRYNDKTINPEKFLKVADLSFLSTSK